MNLESIERHLTSKASLSEAERLHLRSIAQSGLSGPTDDAVALLYGYPAETGVTVKDRQLLEHIVDNACSTHTRALALGLLCNWLSLAKEEIGRILVAILDRTDSGDFLCIKACSCAAMALREVSDPRLARMLVDVFRDETRPEGTRRSVRSALLRLDGMVPRDIKAADILDPDHLQKRAEAVAKRLTSASGKSV